MMIRQQAHHQKFCRRKPLTSAKMERTMPMTPVVPPQAVVCDQTRGFSPGARFRSGVRGSHRVS